MPEPVTTDIQPGQYVIIGQGRWKIKTTWPRVARGGIECTILYLTDEEEYGTIQRHVRINFLSDSKRDSMLRPIDAQDKPARAGLRGFLGNVAEVLSQTEQDEPATFNNTEEPPKPQEWVLRPFWPATGAVGLAAAPSSYKSFLAAAAALQIATGTDVLGLGHPQQEPRTVLYLDWEDSTDSFTRRLRALEVGAGIDHGRHVAFWRPRRSLSAAMEDIHDQLSVINPDAVIIDSMSAAIDGSMNDSDEVNAFWTAVGYLNVPAMVITHKSIENQRRRRSAFQGSGMSLARVRMAWNAEKAEAGNVVWECFKDNHGDTEGYKLAWNIKFHQDGDTLGGVEIGPVDPKSIVLADATQNENEQRRRGVYDQILALLDEAGQEGMLAGDIAAKVHQTKSTIAVRLSEMSADGLTERQKDGRAFRHFHPSHYGGIQDGLPDPLPDPY